MAAETNSNAYRMMDGASLAHRNTPRRAEPGLARSMRTQHCNECFPPRMTPLTERQPEPTPVWLAALIATRCQANGNSGGHSIAWSHVSGRALYTNLGPETEVIHPLGVRLDQGHTVSVTWTPGETAYTVEVHQPYDLCA